MTFINKDIKLHHNPERTLNALEELMRWRKYPEEKPDKEALYLICYGIEYKGVIKLSVDTRWYYPDEEEFPWDGMKYDIIWWKPIGLLPEVDK